MSGSAIRNGCARPSWPHPLSTDNSGISTTVAATTVEKPSPQHLSFGATIRALQGWNPSADSSPEWMAAFGPPPDHAAAPSKDGQNFVQPLGSTSKGPRIHDYRHLFALHTLRRWYRDGEDLEAKLPLLATYLGHQHLSGTQRYLHLTAEIFPEITARVEVAFGEVIPRRTRQ